MKDSHFEVEIGKIFASLPQSGFETLETMAVASVAISLKRIADALEASNARRDDTP